MIKPLVAWPGGKRRLAPLILKLLPQHQCYAEPFAGAAGVLFSKEPSKVEVLNDINGDLISLYRVVQHHLDEFVRQFRWALTSRQIFEWAKISRPETLTDIQRAARFYYLQRLSFGAKVSSRTFGYSPKAPPKLNLLRLEEDLSEAHLRLARVFVEHLPWADCVARYDRPGTVFFMDPPYWQTEGYGVPFPMAEYVQMAEVMGKLQGKAILTINDHPDMRQVFHKFPFQTVEISYTLGGAEAPKKARELVFTSWKPR